MDIKEKIALLFETTYSAKTTDELLEAQRNLEIISKDPEFIRIIFEIMTEKNHDIDLATKKRLKAVQKAATIFLKKMIDGKLEDENVKTDYIYYLADLFYRGLFNNSISKSNKTQFLIILHNLISCDLGKKNIKLFYFNIKTYIIS